MHNHNHASCDSHHGHSHAAPSNFNNIFKVVIAINFLYVLIQVVVAFHANSNSLFADAGHNFGDVLGLVFAFISSLLHERAATQKFSYGLKKTTILAAMSNALILVFTCGVIGYDSVLKFIHPDHIAELDVIIVATLGIFINGASALLFMKGQEDLNIRSAFLHLAYDALISFGVVLGAVIIYFTHWFWLDPVIGILITLTVLSGTLSLLKSSLRLVMDGVPPGLDSEIIKNYLLEKPYVAGVHDLHIWAVSTKENILTAHILIQPGTHVLSQDQMIHELNHAIAEAFDIHHVTLQLEQADCEKGC
jgi:cobalt-zinc-cadmium efflux system protein